MALQPVNRRSVPEDVFEQILARWIPSDAPITVVVDGKAAFEGIVQPDLKTLLKWAAKDNDRTMLFAAELPIKAGN